MFTLNNRNEEYIEGLTISELIKIKKYTYKKKIVSINGDFIEPDEYDKAIIKDGDDVKIHHLLAGG